jgi:hypothetical protein
MPTLITFDLDELQPSALNSLIEVFREVRDNYLDWGDSEFNMQNLAIRYDNLREKAYQALLRNEGKPPNPEPINQALIFKNFMVQVWESDTQTYNTFHNANTVAAAMGGTIIQEAASNAGWWQVYLFNDRSTVEVTVDGSGIKGGNVNYDVRAPKGTISNP